MLILDEALAGLDLSTQAQMTELLGQLQASLSLSYLFITHDLRMAAHLASTIAVMQDGRIVDSGSAAALLSRPQHPETCDLVRSIPQVPAPLSTLADNK